METGRDRVLKAIGHVQPAVVPTNIEGIYNLPAFLSHFGVHDKEAIRQKLDVDVFSARPVYFGPYAAQGLDAFGAPVDEIYGPGGAGYGAGRPYPLASVSTAAEVEKFPWPDPNDFDYEVAVATLKKAPPGKARRIDSKYGLARQNYSREQAAAGGPWLPLVCNLFNLFGIENTLIYFASAPRLIEVAIRKTEEFTLGFLQSLCQSCRGRAEIAYYGDDFSTQNGMMISPEHWRRFLKPSYARIFALLKRYGLKVWFHSCGQFRPVLGDLIDIGMDVWETVQVHLPGNEPEVLKREYGRHITFYGAISTQTTLPLGTEEDVRREVRERIRVLGRNGGYIVGPDHGIMPDVPVKNVLAMFDEARAFRFETASL